MTLRDGAAFILPVGFDYVDDRILTSNTDACSFSCRDHSHRSLSLGRNSRWEAAMQICFACGSCKRPNDSSNR